MKAKKVTTGIATVGILAGATGLTVVTLPAGAESAPSLPKTTPQALVTSVLKAKPAAFGGTVTAQNNLGIPLPKMQQQQDGDYQAKVYSDGKHHFRSTMQAARDDRRTVVEDGKALWSYNSAKRTAHKMPLSAGNGAHKDATRHEAANQKNPAAMGRELVDNLRRSSELKVDGTASVAGRDAYELVLTPKPAEKTLVRQARVAIDAQTKMPLRFELFGHNSTDPALEAGFSKLDVGDQDPALFRFNPPEGTKVVTVDPKRHTGKQHKPKGRTERVGKGWDTVVTGSMKQSPIKQGKQDEHNSGAGNSKTPQQLLKQYTKPAHGKFGKGHVLSTPVGTALLTDDGRYAAGLVPQQVLEHALETK